MVSQDGESDVHVLKFLQMEDAQLNKKVSHPNMRLFIDDL